MNEGVNDEDEDIYKDIGDFRFDKELTKLEESNKAYIEDIANLTKRLNELTERNEALQSVNEVLATNISILLKTAKAEVDRKNLVIDELRKKIEGVSRRYEVNERHSFERSESFKNCVKKAVEGHCNKSDVEDGEIVLDDSEVRSFNSNVGKTDESNNRDRGYHSDNHRKRQKSKKRSRRRSNDRSSRSRKSRYPNENYSCHSSSSRSHHRSTSPDSRGHSDSRTRSGDKSRHSSRSGHSHGSRSQKTKNSTQKEKESSGKSRERRRSVSKKDFEKSGKDGSTGRVREEKTIKTECVIDNKITEVKPCETKKGEKEGGNEENCNVVKTLSVAEYRLRRLNADGNKQKSSSDVLTRQSVLADLYDDPISSKTCPKDIVDKKIPVGPQKDNGEGDCRDWPDDNIYIQRKNKEPKVIKVPKTLYSRRMEAKFQQQQLMEDALSQKCSEGSCEIQENNEDRIIAQESNGEKIAESDFQAEKIMEEGEVACEDEREGPQTGKEEITRVDSTIEVAKETVPKSDEKSTEINLEQSFGESLIKKLLQLQTPQENVGINEFSPLKNNYKLSKISPLKPVSKQHILEYYNLKPSPQQLNNIEPEVLDFSFSLPETPGKNFMNSFLRLGDAKDSSRLEENDSGDEKCTANSPKEEIAVDAESRGESGADDLITALKPNRSKKRNCKTAKSNTVGNETSEAKKLDLTSDEEGGQGKPYKTRYQIRTRSRTENDKINPSEGEDLPKKCGVKSRTEEGGVKRERRLTLSDDGDSGVESKRMKCETPKTENGASIEVTAEGTVPDDITSFEVFRSVSDEATGDVDALVQQVTRLEEKSIGEDLPPWNGDSFTANKTASNEEEAVETETDKGKPSISFTGNSGDSSNFKVLRSYLTLSANDDTEDEAFGSNNDSSDSGEYSDSGASAFVDLL